MSDEVEDQPLAGGHMSGAVRRGDTVRRRVGPWTPAVHALLRHVHGRLPHVPRVLGIDELGREVLTYLPGTQADHESGTVTRARVAAMAHWLRCLHASTADFEHPGPWRMPPEPTPTVIGHNDLAFWNVVFEGDNLVGVFDWDLAGPTTPLSELAFLAWNTVPLWQDAGTTRTLDILTTIAEGYGADAGLGPHEILHAVPTRVQRMLDRTRAAAAAGDPDMVRLVSSHGEQDRRALAALMARVPQLSRQLAGRL
jgi:Ser/Thr protein kinase RdoA (MazF antagonist)